MLIILSLSLSLSLSIIAVTVSPTVVSPVTNLSNIEECGLDLEYFGEKTHEEANCSVSIGNPCIYSVRVGAVYKGDYRVREIYII